MDPTPTKTPLKTIEEKKLEEYEKEVTGVKKVKPDRRKLREQQRFERVITRGKIPRFLSIGLKEKILFAKHLAVMLDAGIPLREALEALREQVQSGPLRYVITFAVKDLSEGQLLGTCLARFPKLFDPFFANVITVGESSGTLPASLRYLAVQLDKTQELRGKIRTALIYPAIVFFGAIGVGIYLAFIILPQLLPLFASLDVKLPLTTRLLIALANFLTGAWVWVLIAFVVLIVGLIVLWQMKPVRFMVYRTILGIPILSNLIRGIQTTQFARILGTLLASGIKIVPALRITADSLTNLVYRREIRKIAERVDRGGTIGDDLRENTKLFNRTAASMVAVGEGTGKLVESLLSLADFTEREVDVMTRNLSTLIEPVVLVLVGVIVGFVALSIITPIYQLTQGLSR